jgi:hypothetical protein
MWRALTAALPLAQAHLNIADSPRHELIKVSRHAEAIADIIKTTRLKKFHICCRDLRLGGRAADVASHPGEFRLAIALARARRK